VANQVDRIDILRLTLEDKLCVPGDMNWNYYGNKTEGWVPQDLVDLAEKAKFNAWKRHGNKREREREREMNDRDKSLKEMKSIKH